MAIPTFTVYKGSESGVPIKSTTTKEGPLRGDEVLIKVTASGVCGTDLHYKHADIVLGHEGVGVVEALGPDVKFLTKGQRVGWGYETNSCEHCLQCLKGEEIYCRDRELYGTASPDQGSFASHAIWREAFVHPIPDALSDEDAAPLQCGGATVFTTLRDAKPNDVIGVLGVGGLGHLAIQFAAKMGCRVVVFSGTSSKREEAMALGAHKFVAMKEEDAQKDKDWWPLDRLLVTSSAQPNWETLLPLMAFQSRIYPLSVSFSNLEVPYLPLILQGIAIQGSLVATRAVHREMLEFAAFHAIKPVIERFPMTEEGVAQAMQKLEDGQVKYRAVLLP